MRERQITSGKRGRILTNTSVWSPDGQWIVYDTRSDAAGKVFDANTIEMVNVSSGEVRELYRTTNNAHCGVATFHPKEWKVIFILGPENPTAEWQYSAWHRQGVIVDTTKPGVAINMDARDVTPPFTPGALRGGSHVHVWDAAGEWISFTYEDHVLAGLVSANRNAEANARNIGVSVPLEPARVSRDHPRNHNGACFSVLVTRTTAEPLPGSDQIKQACEEGWIGERGYVRADGSHQRRALAFQGLVVAKRGETISEVFIVDLPDDLTREGDGPLAGTETRMPCPPAGVTQRRITHTADRKHPGVAGPRHWLRASPDGSRIAFIMLDEQQRAQLWTVSPNGGQPVQLSRNAHAVTSAFSWNRAGTLIAHTMDNSVCVTEATTGRTIRLTSRSSDPSAPRPEACVFSPDGRFIAFVRQLVDAKSGELCNQICTVEAPE